MQVQSQAKALALRKRVRRHHSLHLRQRLRVASVLCNVLVTEVPDRLGRASSPLRAEHRKEPPVGRAVLCTPLWIHQIGAHGVPRPTLAGRTAVIHSRAIGSFDVYFFAAPRLPPATRCSDLFRAMTK